MIQRPEVEFQILSKWVNDHPDINTSVKSRLSSKMLEFVEEFPYKADTWDEVVAKRGEAWVKVALEELEELGLKEDYVNDVAPLVDRMMADAWMLQMVGEKLETAKRALGTVRTITEFNDYRKLIMELRNTASAGQPL